MSTISINRRQAPVAVAAAAGLAVLGFAGFTVAQGDTGSPTFDRGQHTMQHHGNYHPTTSGGRTMPGLP
jgi:hypothetical protein